MNTYNVTLAFDAGWGVGLYAAKVKADSAEAAQDAAVAAAAEEDIATAEDVADCRVAEVQELAKLYALADQLSGLWESLDDGTEEYNNTDTALAIAGMESDVHALIRELDA